MDEIQPSSTVTEQILKPNLLENTPTSNQLHHHTNHESKHRHSPIQKLSSLMESPAPLTANNLHPWLPGDGDRQACFHPNTIPGLQIQKNCAYQA
jgi:hypothetical protein